jgi:hypothetical protein
MLLAGEGPSGYIHRGQPVPARPALSFRPGPQHAFGFISANEAAIDRYHVSLSPVQGAGYLHVDDLLIITEKESRTDAGAIMEVFADVFESAGLSVPVDERKHPNQIDKVVGYKFVSAPARLRLPDKKRFALQHVLFGLANQYSIDTDILPWLVQLWRAA